MKFNYWINQPTDENLKKNKYDKHSTARRPTTPNLANCQ